MLRRLVVPIAVLVLCVIPRASRGAEEPAAPDRGQFTITGGMGVPSGPLRESGLAAPPPLYGGLEVQVRVRGPVGVGVMLGADSATGWLLGANVRLEHHATEHLFVSGGLGSVAVPSSSLAGAVFVRADVSLSVRFARNVALMIGPMLDVDVHHGGTDHCGVDTCDSWVAPGARIFTLRAGFGGAF